MKRRTFLAGLASTLACRPRAPEAPPPELPSQTLPAPPSSIQPPNPMTLGLMPVLEPDQIREQYRNFASYLGETLQTTISLHLAADYPSAIAAAVDGRVDVAQLSPLAYVEAKERNPALYPLVANISDGSSTYSGYLVARRGLRIRSPAQLVGKRLGLVHPSSASGYLYPYAFLLDQGVNPDRDCEVVLLGRHDRLLIALTEGRIDVAATFSGALNHAEQRGVDTSGLEIIAKTGRIPHDAWLARPTLGQDVHDAVQHALLSLSTRDRSGRRILAPIRSINAFSRVDDDHYDQVRQVRLRSQSWGRHEPQ